MYAKRYKRPAPELSGEALAVLRGHSWPGNVRELEHWIESAVVLAPDGRIGTGHLPRMRKAVVAAPVPEARSGTGTGTSTGTSREGGVAIELGLTLEEATRRYVAATLEACDGNKAEAARRLEIGRNTIGRMFNRDSDPGGDDE